MVGPNMIKVAPWKQERGGGLGWDREGCMGGGWRRLGWGVEKVRVRIENARVGDREG